MKKQYNTTVDIQKRLKQIDKLYKKLSIEETELEHKLCHICDCSSDKLVRIIDYTSGDYYNTGYYEIYDQCKICGKKHNYTKKSTGSYN